MTSEERSISNIKIEKANVRDISDIIGVEEESWISSYPNTKFGITDEDVKARFSKEFKKQRTAEIKKEIRSGKHLYKIVKQNGGVVAYSHLLKEDEFGDLVEVYVKPAYQGMGIGGTLIKDGIKYLGTDKPIRLEVSTYNPAINVYKHFGFGVNPNLYQAKDEKWNTLPSGKKIPVVIMERK